MGSSNTILITSANHNKYENEENDANQMNMDCNESIYSAISCVYVLTQQPPKLNKLHQILYQRPYKGEPTPAVSVDIGDDDAKQNRVDLSLDGLKLLVQCSDKELLDGLDQINAIEIENEWRIIDDEYLYLCFQDLLYCIMEKQIDFKRFRAIEILQNMKDYPTEIINHCIKIHSLNRREDVDGYWSFDEDKVCVFIAKRLLKENKNKMKENEFMQKWNEGLPYGLEPNSRMLIGHCILLKDKILGNYLSVFEEKSLSLDAKKRFQQLFEKKNEWDMESIKPYLCGLMKSGQTADKLLLRHSRMVRTKGTDGKEKRIYISRNAKQNK